MKTYSPRYVWNFAHSQFRLWVKGEKANFALDEEKEFFDWLGARMAELGADSETINRIFRRLPQ